MAVLVTSLARVAVAQSTPASTPEVAPSASVQTPLSVRPARPLSLDAPSGGTSLVWKLMALAVVAGAGFVAWQRRARRPAPRDLELRIVRRASLGAKSELVVVLVEGQRLLLGVTANAIQSLLILPDEDARDEAVAPVPAEAPSRDLESQVRGREELDRPRDREPAVARAVARPMARPFDDDEPFEEQARGLMALRARP
jgi:flagellar biogenesis protein FliO